MRRLVLAFAVLALAAPTAAAERHAPKKAKRAKPRPAKIVDVAGAVASGEPDRICGAALDLATARELVRASLLLDACAGLPERAAAVRTARAAVDKAAARDEWSPVEIVLVGKGAATATVAIDAFPGIPFAEGAWKLPAGTYHLTATTAGGETTYDLVLAANSRALVMIEPPLPPGPAANGVIDFGADDGAPLDAPIAGPPVVKHESLLPERYRKGMKQCGAIACRKQPE